jgi:S1-C subfamily serine protease
VAWLLAILVLPIGSIAQTTSQEQSVAAIAREATPATATILTLDAHGDTLAQGSCFIVRSDGVLLTNWHVMEGASAALVIRPNGERYSRVEFLDGDSTADIALLKIPGYALPVLTPRSDSPDVGDRVVAIGSPLGLHETVTEGIVSAKRMIGGRELIQISAAISPGSSGGAVLDEQGHVFAISTSYMSGGQQLDFAVPIRYALGLLTTQLIPRSLAGVFAGTADPTLAGSSQVSNSVASSDRDALEPLSVTSGAIRPSLAGSWIGSLMLRSTEHPGQETWYQALVLAGQHFGLLALMRANADSVFGPKDVYPITEISTSANGDVIAEVSGTTFSGYQTKSGFVAIAKQDHGAQTDTFRLYVDSVRIPIAENMGLYHAIARMGYFTPSGAMVGHRADWNGDLVMYVADDSLYVGMALSNRVGGGSVFYASAPWSGGEFRIVMNLRTARSILAGSVHDGVLRATLTDYRDKGFYFQGPITAERR